MMYREYPSSGSSVFRKEGHKDPQIFRLLHTALAPNCREDYSSIKSQPPTLVKHQCRSAPCTVEEVLLALAITVEVLALRGFAAAACALFRLRADPSRA